jgi:hypothetical protein
MNSKIPLIFITLLLIGCGALFFFTYETKAPNDPNTLVIDPFTATLQNPSTEVLPKLSEYTLEQFKNKTPNNLARIMTSNGVRFSPYVAMTDNDRFIGINGMTHLFTDPDTYAWGIQDGSGEVIALTGTDYITNNITNKPYLTAKPTINGAIGRGNMISNITETYLNHAWVEYHIPPTDEGGMDWQSLIFVFEYQHNQWFLVGVITDRWTI